MLGLRVSKNTKLWVSRWGTLCGVFAMLVFVMGCPVPQQPCEVSADCDDGVFCNGAETCDPETLVCVAGVDPCIEGEDCDEDANLCFLPCTEDADCDDLDACTTEVCTEEVCVYTDVVCDDLDACTDEVCDPATGCVYTDVECDDGVFCNGVETCVDGQCVAGTPECEDDGLFCNGPETCDEDIDDCVAEAPCLEGEVCIEASDRCTTPCEVDADCADDGDPCTVETCTEQVCLSTAKVCDDDLFCTGTETCNAETGDCESSGDPCDPATEVCNEATDACDSGTPCTDDTDCPDDGVFCNGDESCGADDFCVSSGDPCNIAAGQTCNEDLNTCVSPPGETINFTLGVDNLSGTGGDDTFSGLLAFNAPTGTNVPTLQTSDAANGGDGDDVLTAQLDAGGVNSTLSPTLTSIETWNLTDLGAPGGGATTISAINATGVTAINSVNSQDDAVTITNLNALANLGVTNTISDFLVTFIAPATNANTDAMTLTLSSARAGCTITITTPVNGVETLNVVSTGAAANVVDALTQAVGTTLTAFNVSGTQNLTVTGALNTTLTTVNAGTATGATTLDLTGNALTVAYPGGAGNDSVNFAAGYTTADTINGGTGVNILGLNGAQAVAATTAQSNVTNIQTIRIGDSLNGNVDVTKFGATNVVLDTVAAATALLAGNSVVTLGTAAPTATLNNDDTGAFTLGLTVGGPGTTDTLAVNVQNADLDAALTITGAEVVTFASGNGSDGTAADGNANTATAITLTPTFGAGIINFTGSVAVTMTGALTAGTISAANLQAALTMGAASAVGSTIAGSPYNDVLFGSTLQDSISGGDGNDKIVGSTIGDSFVGGNGSDTFQYTAVTDGGAADANNVGMDLINGFVVGTGGDILGFQDNIFFVNGDTLDLDIITGAAAGNVVTGLTDGGAGKAQVIVQTTPLTNFAAVEALFTAIDGVITTTTAVVIAEVSGQGTFVFYDGNTAVAAGEVVLGQLVGVTGANLSSMVAANLAINDG